MSATSRRQDPDAYQRSSAVARDLRETVADQLHDLVVEHESLGSQGEFAESVQRVAQVLQNLRQAQGQQKQARELGLPLAPAIAKERAALSTLRQVVMSTAAAAAAWVTSMDFDAYRHALENEPPNGRRRRRPDEDDI